MEYLDSILSKYTPVIPGTLTLDTSEGVGRAYLFKSDAGSLYDLVSATTVTGWGTEDSKVIRHYAAKLSDEKTPFNEAIELAGWYSDWAARFGTLFHSSVHRALQTGLDHPIRRLPSFSTATVASCEQRVWSLFDSLAGTVDLILIHKDGAVSIHDVKTHSRFYSRAMEDEDVGLWQLDRGIQKSKFTKWWKQLSIYARCLEQTFGVSIAFGSILVYNVHTGVMSEEGVVTGEALAKKFSKSVAPKMPLIVDAMFDYGF